MSPVNAMQPPSGIRGLGRLGDEGGWQVIDLDATGEGASHAGRTGREARGGDAFEVLQLEFQGVRAQAAEHGRNRIALLAACFVVAFFVLGARVLDLTLTGQGVVTTAHQTSETGPVHRASLTDRNGEMLATDVSVPSLYVDSRRVIEPEATADALLTVLPHLDREALVAKLTSGSAFTWIERKLGPRQQAAIHALGLPGLGFEREPHRVYPKGHSAAHTLGYVDIDNNGIAGLERGLEAQMRGSDAPVALSLDMRVQHLVEEELTDAITTFKAKAGAGVVLDVNTGEIYALASLPDFDPNAPAATPPSTRFNMATRGVYEMGSTFKIFTAAIALETGAATLTKEYDARTPISVAGYTISDYHAEKRWLTVPEIVMHSSNIGTAKMAVDVGVTRHREYLGRLGLLERPDVELPEAAAPLLPRQWHEVETMTISYGHGLAISPLQLASAGAAIANGGWKVKPTFLRREGVPADRERVLSEQTAHDVVSLMRMVVTDGTGSHAGVPGYEVAGKTGTAEKATAGGYSRHKLLTSFLAVFPARAPRFLVLVVLDEPQPVKGTHGYATAGWNAAPAAGKLIRRIAPVLGIAPVPMDPLPDLQAPRVVDVDYVR